jgi:superfamily II DNA or RNA helicase
MLRIPKAGLSARDVDALRRLAACPNSDFYRAQAMRQSTYRIPRVLFFGEEDGETLSLPRGCLPALEELFERGASSYELVDRRACGRPVAMSFVGELRPEQRRALDALLGADCGVLEAATGFGKTVVAAALIAELGVSTLVLVPTSALLDQWCEQLGRFLAIEDEPLVALTPTGRRAKRQPGAVGRIGGGHTLRSGLVDVALCQSLVGHDKETGDHPARQDVLRDYGLVICDECHHVAAETFSRVVAAAPARRLYGLSATPRREDSRRPSVFMYCGPVVHTFDAREHRAGQAFARRLVPRFLATRLPEDVRPNDFVQVGAALARDPERNAVIVADALRLVEQGRTPIVLVRLVEHARLLGADLERLGATVYVLVGSDDEGRRQEVLEAVRAAPKGEPFVLVATGSYAGEGFDDDRLDALLLAAPVKGQRLVSQYTGRLHRDAPSKSDVVVYDYVDVRVPMLERMHHARLSTYGKLGYDVSVPDGDGETPGTIVDREELPGRLSADVAAAKASVTVVTRYALLKAGSPLADALADARARGVRVTLRVGSPRSSVPADLRPCLQVEAGEGRKPATPEDAEGTPNDVGSTPARPATRSNFAVIDGGTVWYGELPLLAPERDEDLRALRFHNPAVAHELLADAGLA